MQQLNTLTKKVPFDWLNPIPDFRCQVLVVSMRSMVPVNDEILNDWATVSLDNKYGERKRINIYKRLKNDQVKTFVIDSFNLVE